MVKRKLQRRFCRTCGEAGHDSRTCSLRQPTLSEPYFDCEDTKQNLTPASCSLPMVPMDVNVDSSVTVLAEIDNMSDLHVIPGESVVKEEQMTRIEDILDSCVPERQRSDLMRVLYGCDLERDGRLEICTEAHQMAAELKVDLRSYRFMGSIEQLRAPRIVRVCAVQHKMPLNSSEPVAAQLAAVHHRVEELVKIAAAAGANILCLQETWHMPFFICTREKMPWCEFAEVVPSGPSTQFLQRLAAAYKMVIISPMLERDEIHGDTIWNCATVLGPDGSYLGKTRKNHIPRVGDFNESTYYMESELGHPVFDTPYGKVAVNICYGRHHPQNWMAFGLNGAEIVFNPSATVDGLSEAFWPIEARNAAMANSYFTVAINRVGTEHFSNPFTSGNGSAAHHDFGHFYGSSYMTAPDGRRTPGLSRLTDGVLVTEIDLNMCRQAKDNWGFRMTQRLPIYAKLLTRASRSDFQPQLVKKDSTDEPYII